jgi:hypothetical protein
MFAVIRLFAQNPQQTISVDAAANRHPISQLIYGVAFSTTADLENLNAPLHRSGGNAETRYNWKINADNRAADYFFESIGDPSSTPGQRDDTFISESKAANAQAMITIPLIPWIAHLGPSRSIVCSFSQAKYGAQQSSDPYDPDCGNGVLTNGNEITGNNPNDANVPNSPGFQSGWIQHLVNTWGTAANGGLKYYLLDNEASIWFSTHRDVVPTGVKMGAMLTKMVNTSKMIKQTDPTALVSGPEEWGWDGYFYSGYDQQYASEHGYCCYPDRKAHGGEDYIPWLLDQLKAQSTSGGTRLLDIVSVHYYPQGGEFSNNVSTQMQLLRNQSTRSLWDPNYVDQSWIDAKVKLIPRMKGWVTNHYFAGTPIALTEYNWGAEEHINGATTQADILGIFGREGLNLASRWTSPDPAGPVYKAFQMYRNYDGHKATFGNTSVSTAAPDPDHVAAFGAIRSSDQALTVMVVCKTLTGTTPVQVNSANFTGHGTAHVYQLTSANTIQQLGDIPAPNGTFSFTSPAQSVTLFVIP